MKAIIVTCDIAVPVADVEYIDLPVRGHMSFPGAPACPIFEGLAGPFYEGDGQVRYESWSAINLLSE